LIGYITGLGYALYTHNWLAATGFALCLFMHYSMYVVVKRLVKYQETLERGLPVLQQAAALLRAGGVSVQEENRPVIH
jgi:hypothetical protein